MTGTFFTLILLSYTDLRDPYNVDKPVTVIAPTVIERHLTEQECKDFGNSVVFQLQRPDDGQQFDFECVKEPKK